MAKEDDKARRMADLRRSLAMPSPSASDAALLVSLQERAEGEGLPNGVAAIPDDGSDSETIVPVEFPLAPAQRETAVIEPEAGEASRPEAPGAAPAEPAAAPSPSPSWVHHAQRVAGFVRPRGKRKAVAVTAEVFARVSYLALEFRLNKLEVLTCLMLETLPKGYTASFEKLPAWLRQGGDVNAEREQFLSYVEDERMLERLAPLLKDCGLRLVDVVERVVLRALEAPPRRFPAKQRRIVRGVGRRGP
jgi:hypothetical protein